MTNQGLAGRQNLENGIAQSEIHRSYYTYTISIDLERIGIDGDIEVSQSEKAERIKVLLDGIHYLYRDIRGRRENLSPLFIIGGRYERKNPFFENRIKIKGNQIQINPLKQILNDDENIDKHTFVGVIDDIFDNTKQIKEELRAESIGTMFSQLKKEVDQYYGESN